MTRAMSLAEFITRVDEIEGISHEILSSFHAACAEEPVTLSPHALTTAYTLGLVRPDNNKPTTVGLKAHLYEIRDALTVFFLKMSGGATLKEAGQMATSSLFLAQANRTRCLTTQ